MILGYIQIISLLLGSLLFLYGWLFPELLRAAILASIGLWLIIFGLADIPPDFEIKTIWQNESSEAIEKSE